MYNESKMKQQYSIQKWNAENKRNIEWKLSFDEWKRIWLNSGKYNQRGIYRGQYQMCRFNDEGPYSIDNVRIDTTESNLTERKGKIENGRLERWQRDGEKEKQAERMLKIAQTDGYKESMKKYLESEQYKINRQKNGEALTKKLSKPVIATNIISGESIELIGEKDMKNKGFTPSSVNKCANGKLKSHHGYTFKFKEKICFTNN